MEVSKAVRQKLFESKGGRFSGAECHASALFTRMVSALRTTFVTEDIGFAPTLFQLDNATLPVRVEANNLLFSTLELMMIDDPTSPAADWKDSSNSSFPADGNRVLLEFARRMIPSGDPFQGQSDMLGVRIAAGIDPHDAIGEFNAALKAARTRVTLLDEDVKTLFIQALDSTFYQPVVSRLLLHNQRAAHGLSTIQQWVRECYTAHVKTRLRPRGLDEDDGTGPQAAIGCFHRLRRVRIFASRYLGLLLRRGGRELGACAARFQHAIDHDDVEEFDALCVLAGGKPDIVADVSACSFCEEDGED
ncbi:hypothetical protein CYMTET_18687 [Cymbomonas tetramitiformis]|uniref:Uncharacterized protein n=1 Tax=Cymbomonas tetramitiformis TaxID=36881 RepID=A0AAE0G7I5_9CHLO|nr:hypothetical protein CYMTET_18687 [Cymbomonas tetramitiformis]